MRKTEIVRSNLNFECIGMPSSTCGDENEIESEVMQSNDGGAIVVVAKCPIPGKSKTRLLPLLGMEGSAKLARCMLSDILTTLVNYKPLKTIRIILYFAPGTDEGKGIMEELLNELEIRDQIHVRLIPMLSGDLQGADLGDQLRNGLQQARKVTTGNVMFLGMDSPELPLEELVEAFRHANAATMCPSQDGGYGMLCVPHHVPPTIFSNILWSHPLTAVSQLKALTDCGCEIRLGRIMHDMDEPEDVLDLQRRQRREQGDAATAKASCLNLTSSSDADMLTSECKLTNQALTDLLQ